MRELIARIHALLRRSYGDLSQISFGEKMVFGELQIDLEKLQVSLSGVPINLTPTEFRLLRYLAEFIPIGHSAERYLLKPYGAMKA